MSDYTIDEESFTGQHYQNLKKLHEASKVARWISERIDKEIRGAYRAGYNYLYIGEPRQPMKWDQPKEKFTVKYHPIPSYTSVDEWEGDLPNGEELRWQEYDLTGLTDEDLKQ